MRDPLPIRPFTQPLDDQILLPGSKSITNRALILAALADGKTHLEGALFSRDTRIMLAALKELGFSCEVNEAEKNITIVGNNGAIPKSEATLYVGNAGTAARFLVAFLAIQPEGTFHLDGDPAMRVRPMSGLLDALETLEAASFTFHGEPGHFPFTMQTSGYEGGSCEVDASASSQILSALLLSAAVCKKPIQLTCPGVRASYVAITLNMREAFGATPLEADPEGRYEVTPTQYKNGDNGHYSIEPDVSAASYFLALTLINGGKLEIPHLSAKPMQGDSRFIEVLAHHGLEVDAIDRAWTLRSSSPHDIQRDHREIDFNLFSDTFLTYAAIAPLLGESIRITGIAHTRKQETDRIAGMASELSKLGQLVKEESDALTILPKPNELRARALRARSEGHLLEVDTYEDHRFAMSFGVLGSFDLLDDGEPWLAIKDPECCGKTFPEFFDCLEALQGL